MNYETLDINLDMGIKSNSNMSTKSVRFGDGYKQLYSFGINNKSLNWSGSKTGDYLTIIKPIEDFLENHKGVIPFYWLDPTGKTKLYTCESWTASQNKGNIWNISLDFEQFLST